MVLGRSRHVGSMVFGIVVVAVAAARCDSMGKVR